MTVPWPTFLNGKQLDELDGELIESLRSDGRKSYRKIAAEVGVPEATVRKRVKRLLDEGLIQVVAIPALRNDVSNVVGSVRLTVEGRDPSDIADELSTWDEVIWIALGVGRTPVLVELIGEDIEAIGESFQKLFTVAGVSSAEPVVLSEVRKQLYIGPLRIR